MKRSKKSQIKSQCPPISSRAELHPSNKPQVRARQATVSHSFGIPDTEQVTGSIPVPPTRRTCENSPPRVVIHFSLGDYRLRGRAGFTPGGKRIRVMQTRRCVREAIPPNGSSRARHIWISARSPVPGADSLYRVASALELDQAIGRLDDRRSIERYRGDECEDEHKHCD